MSAAADEGHRRARNFLRRPSASQTAVVFAAAFFSLLAAVAAPAAAHADNARTFGGFGPEGLRMREQLWIVPGADPDVPLRATLFRPADAVPPPSPEPFPQLKDSDVPAVLRRPLVVINHGTDVRTRLSVSMPVYYWLSRWFVDRGYAVLLPQRRGHGATGGMLAEGQDVCRDPDHYNSGLTAADDIEAAMAFMAQQPFVDRSRIVVVGISTGGWASLALASRNPPGLQAVINFSGGRGGHARGVPNAVCAPDRLVAAARRYGENARVPTLWLYARNDSYFGPDLALSMESAWQGAGGEAEMHVLSAYGDDGHYLANDEAGWDLWGPHVESFLKAHPPAAVVAHDGAAAPAVAHNGAAAPGAPDAVATAADTPVRRQ